MAVNYDHPLTYVEIDVEFVRWKDGFGTNTLANDYQSWTPYTLANVEDTTEHEVVSHTYRFNVPSQYADASLYSYPTINSIALTPAEINPGISIGKRLSGSIVFANHPSSDSDIDPRAYDRSYDPMEKGTFWGKLTAKNPFLRNSPLRILRGYEGQALNQFTVQHLLVDGVVGDSSSDKFTVKFVDIFRFLDNDQAKAPNTSLGLLEADINETDTTFDVQSGAGDTYPSSGFLSIGKEIVSFTRVTDAFTITRGQQNTEADDHKEGDIAQLCLEYTPQAVSDILYDLFTNYTDVDPAWINKTEWDNEVFTHANFLYSALIGKPENVKTLINELIQQVGLIIHQDEISQSIKLEAIKEIPASATTFDDSHFPMSSFSKSIQDSKLITEMTTWYGRQNPLEQINEKKNYQNGLLHVGQINATPLSIKKEIFSRWIPQNSYDTAVRVNKLFLERYQLPPSILTFTLVDNGNVSLDVGSSVNVKSRFVEDAYGNPQTLPCRVISLDNQSGLIKIKFEENRLEIDPQFGSTDTFTITSDIDTGLNLRDFHDTIKATPPVTGDEYTFIIQSGVKVGGRPGVEVGTWPPGVTLTLINSGDIYGAGGHGGYPPNKDGGHALNINYAISIDNQGSINAGGGGGGAADGAYDSGNGFPNASGGGGAGFPVGTLGITSNHDGGTVGQAGTLTTGGIGSSVHIQVGPTQNYSNGGSGGDIAQPGTIASFSSSYPGNTLYAPGVAGSAVEGDSFITWINTGTRNGAIN